MPEFLSRQLQPSQWLIDVMALGFLLGAIDYFRNNRWGLGKRFEDGLATFPAVFINMAGIIVLIPLLSLLLSPIGRIAAALGLDPATPVGCVLANDMGGFQLAHALTQNSAAGDLSGMLLGAMLGVNIVSTIPLALLMIQREERPFLARGMTCGFVTVPLGVLTGALVAGIPLRFALIQLLPVLFFIALLAFFFCKFPHAAERCFIAFGRGILAIALAGAAAGILKELCGVPIPLVGPMWDAMKIVSAVMLVLPGAYVVMELVSRAGHPLFLKLGRRLGIHDTAVLGLVCSLANDLPTLSSMHQMDARGKFLNFAFLTSAAYAFGDHLAFCISVAPRLILPLVIGKVVAGLSAVTLAWFLTRPPIPNADHR